VLSSAPDLEDTVPSDEERMSDDVSTTSANADPLISSIFDLADAKTDEDIRKNKIVVSKEGRGTKGSREYGIHYKMATDRLSCLFDAPAHFTPIVRQEDADSGTCPPYKDIQSMYVGNHDKLEALEDRCRKMDLMEVLMIPDYNDQNASHPKDKWKGDDSKKNLLSHWSQIPLAQVIDYQQDINRYSSHDGVSSKWLKDLLYVSSRPEL
jgi:hypothetical protein